MTPLKLIAHLFSTLLLAPLAALLAADGQETSIISLCFAKSEVDARVSQTKN